ncbi:MAG: phosphatidylglycerophosphatase A [Betaproteobacteria bacterium]|nr:phosphatidylglycerophosphatase A [Betaproteobacteria bacterium]
MNVAPPRLFSPSLLIAMGFGTGLSPYAPGTVASAWAWLSFNVLQPVMPDWGWALLLVSGFFLGLWAIGRTSRLLNQQDPSSIVWDEILAFWLLLWVLNGSWVQEALAFVLFRFFDVLKPGPVAWADRRFKGAFGVMFDDLIAAGLSLFSMAVLLRTLGEV